MLQFTNGFSCAMDQSKGEMIIKFLQQFPDLDDAGNIVDVQREEVVTLAMSTVTAKNLVDVLGEILNDELEEEEGKG